MLETLRREELDLNLLRLARGVRALGYVFITPTPATHARVNARQGAEWASDLRGVLGWSRPFRPGAIPAEIEALMHEAGTLEPHEDGWRSTIRMSTLDEFTFVHSAYPTTAPDSVFFGPDTYRFARAIRACRRSRVTRAADIGCGAGPGAVLLARSHPGAEILGLDINAAALRLTRVNAALNGVTLEARHSDLLAGTSGTFDLLVANPPYLVDPVARAYRHGGGALGAGLSLAILDAAMERLAPAGTLLLYTGAAIVGGRDPFNEDVSARLRGAAFTWTYEEIDPDVFGEELEAGPYRDADRIAAVCLTATREG